jgi:hypothetical protein
MEGILWWNCGGSLKGKIESIKYHIGKYKPMIFFVSEADSKHDDCPMVGVDGYDLMTPKTEKMFRVAAYIRAKLPATQIEIE